MSIYDNNLDELQSYPRTDNHGLPLHIPVLNFQLERRDCSRNIDTVELDDRFKKYKFLAEQPEDDLDSDDKRNLLNLAYQIADDRSTNKDSMAMIRRLVLSNIVQRTKFIEGEHLDAVPLKQKDKIRDFPSFWRPDFSTESKCRLQMDLFKRIGGLENASLVHKAQYWMSVRLQVLKVVREHRATTCNFAKQKIVEGLATLQVWEDENKLDERDENSLQDDDHSSGISLTSHSSTILESIKENMHGRSVFYGMNIRDIRELLLGLKTIREFMGKGINERDTLPNFLRSDTVTTQIFGAYVFFCLNCAIPRTDWETNRSQVRIGKLFTIFDEAMIQLFMLNHWDNWVSMAKGQPPTKQNRQSVYTWCKCSRKGTVIRGWSGDGLKRYDALLRELAVLRNRKTQVDMENELLNEYIKMEDGKSNNKKRKIENEINETEDEQYDMIDPYDFQYTPV